MSSPRTIPFLPAIAAILATTAPATAQSLLPTRGQPVIKASDTPTFLGGELVLACERPVMDRNGAILVRVDMATSGTLSTLETRALVLGHTDNDLAVVVQSNQLDPSGTFPNSRLLPVSSGSGAAQDPSLVSVFWQRYRISPTGGYLVFSSQLWDGANPGADGLVHSAGIGTINDSVIYWGHPGALQILAQQNVTAMPGGAVLATAFGTFSQQASGLNSAGTYVFRSALAGGDVVGTTNDNALVAGVPGNLAYVMREADPLLGGAVAIGSFGSNVWLNEAGQVLFEAQLSTTLGTTPATSANNQVAVVATPTGPGTWSHAVLVREGDPALDANGQPLPGVTYGSPALAWGFTDNGIAAFRTPLAGAVTSANNQAIYRGTPGDVRLVARNGDIAPGTGGETIVTLSTEVSVSAAGVLFGALLAQPGIGGVNANNNSVLYLARPGEALLPLAREGDPCPGMPGFVFGFLSGSTNLGTDAAARLNERGQVIFSFGCNDGVANRTILYSWDPLHGLQPQLRSGEFLGGATIPSFETPMQFQSGGNPLGFNGNGDFLALCATPALGSPSTANMVVRGHVGSLHATPSAVPVAGGTPQTIAIDCTPLHALNFYAVVATSMGTDVGFAHPFNASLEVPLNFDPLWTVLSVELSNSPIWGNTIGILDANGQAAATFTMPPGNPGFLGSTVHHAVALFDFGLVGTAVTEPAPCHLY